MLHFFHVKERLAIQWRYVIFLAGMLGVVENLAPSLVVGVTCVVSGVAIVLLACVMKKERGWDKWMAKPADVLQHLVTSGARPACLVSEQNLQPAENRPGTDVIRIDWVPNTVLVFNTLRMESDRVRQLIQSSQGLGQLLGYLFPRCNADDERAKHTQLITWRCVSSTTGDQQPWLNLDLWWEDAPACPDLDARLKAKCTALNKCMPKRQRLAYSTQPRTLYTDCDCRACNG